MIHILAIRISDYLIQNGVGNQGKCELYTYVIETGIEKIITYTVLLILAIYLKLLFPSILFVTFFIILRGYTGGFHAHTYLGCFISSILMYLICVQVIAPFFISEKIYMYIGLLIIGIAIILLAPINHPNQNMNSDEIKKCKRGARLVMVLELGYIIVAIFLRINTVYIVMPFLGAMMCAVLLILAKIIRQEVRKDEKFLI